MPGFNKHIDDYLVQQIVTRLILPWRNWPAFRYGIIDKDGKVLRKKATLKTKEEQDSWGYLDILCCNLRKILSDYPTTRMRLAQLNLIQTANLPQTPGQPPTIPLSTLAGSFFLLKDEYIPDPEDIQDVRKRFEKFLDEEIHVKDKGKYVEVHAHEPDRPSVGYARVIKGNNNRAGGPHAEFITVDKDRRGRGIGNKMLDAASKVAGKLVPSHTQSDDAKRMWKRRNTNENVFFSYGKTNNNKNHWIVVKDANTRQEVGHVISNEEPRVRGAFLKPEYRSKGIAKQMYDALQLRLGSTIHPDDQQSPAAKKFWHKRYKEQAPFTEEAAANGVGGGAIAGVGVGAYGEPGRRKSVLAYLRRKRKI